MEPRVFASLDPFFESGPVLGRRMANVKFLTALVRAQAFAGYHFFTPSKAVRDELREQLAAVFPEQATAGLFAVRTRLELPQALANEPYHVFHLSDCINYPFHLARMRNALAGEIFPITGTTHSLSYAAHPLSFACHIWPGVTPRDAIISTSTAGKQVVDAYMDGIAAAYGLSPASFPRPRVEVIPLGVEPGDFVPPSPQERAKARASLGVGADQTVILVFGRIDHASKMDILPLLRALQRLILDGIPAGSLRLVLAGWIEEEDERFTKTLAELCANIGLALTCLPRPTEAGKRDIYAASDIFCSPVDNPQETFGLTLLEAQAMGLPVVASDFDGYRDLVLPGKTGLLVPVTGPVRTQSVDMLAPFTPDNQYHLHLAQRHAVDVPALAAAIKTLAGDPGLRAALGSKGRERALAFSWDACAARHLALWDELWTEGPGDRAALADVRHPLQPDYARIFAAYPTRALGDADRLGLTRTGQAVLRNQDFPLIYDGLEHLIAPDLVRRVLVAARKPVAVKALRDKLGGDVPGLTAERAEAHILFALKHDLLEIRGDP